MKTLKYAWRFLMRSNRILSLIYWDWHSVWHAVSS